MKYKQGRYSGFLKPILALTDLVMLNMVYFFFNINVTSPLLFCLYVSVVWIFISVVNRFYEVQRHTKILHVASLLTKQIVYCSVAFYAFIGFFKQPEISRFALGNYLIVVFVLIALFKFFVFLFLRKYRKILSGNIRKVVVIGDNKKTEQLIKTFSTRPHFGYVLEHKFNPKKEGFTLEACYKYIIDKDIDEIYFSVSELTNKQIIRLINFADNNLRVLKFIPDNKDIFSRKLKYEYYDYTPILSLRTIPLQETINKIVKRAFDVVFSLCVLVFLLSWLTPIIALLIRLESKGPIFFKQARNGLKYKEFQCYKFRSMIPNKTANLHQATKGDLRVTKVGAFIRKTSIDELPQFYNVLFGHMSVVGPRPHMVSHTNMYAQKVDKFMVRHFVKPGITGLAQVSGFRGEIEEDKDIINRVKYDIFYIENWSLLLDLKIIIQTVLNAIRGEEKAY